EGRCARGHPAGGPTRERDGSRGRERAGDGRQGSGPVNWSRKPLFGHPLLGVLLGVGEILTTVFGLRFDRSAKGLVCFLPDVALADQGGPGGTFEKDAV